MFDGFGLFGTGIGTGIIGKIEDAGYGIRNAVSDAARSWENAGLEQEDSQYDEEKRERRSMYWDLIDFENVPALVKEATEDIFLILNGEWDYRDKKENKNMLRIFKNPDALLKKVLDIKPKLAGKIVKLDESLEEMIENGRNEGVEGVTLADVRFYSLEKNKKEERAEKLTRQKRREISLGTFVFQMALYRFCISHFPQIEEGIENRKIDIEELDLERWEHLLWKMDEDDDILEIDSEDISSKREDLKSCYRAPFNFFDVWEFKVDDSFKLMREDGLSSKLEFFERALDDSETVDAVRKMRDDSFEVSKKNEGEGVKEIQSMRHLLDIMERSIKGELMEQDKVELKDKAEEWGRDIETLIEMLNKSMAE